MIETGDLRSGEGSETTADVVTPYVAEVSTSFTSRAAFVVVFDAGNGTGGPVMHRILDNLNVEAIELFFEMDGRFPNHHPDPTVPDEPAGADRRRCARPKADLGIAFDGDTDRIGAVDESGDDRLGRPADGHLRARNSDAQAGRDVHRRSEMLAVDVRRSAGARRNPIMWKTGHSLIKAKMKETHAELAGEMSGHMFFADRYYGFDDALYSACRLMEIVATRGSRSRRSSPTCLDAGHARDSLRLSGRDQVRGGGEASRSCARATPGSMSMACA